jgi:hypothetical protein
MAGRTVNARNFGRIFFFSPDYEIALWPLTRNNRAMIGREPLLGLIGYGRSHVAPAAAVIPLWRWRREFQAAARWRTW